MPCPDITLSPERAPCSLPRGLKPAPQSEMHLEPASASLQAPSLAVTWTSSPFSGLLLRVHSLSLTRVPALTYDDCLNQKDQYLRSTLQFPFKQLCPSVSTVKAATS